jgi:hypothetical protein
MRLPGLLADRVAEPGPIVAVLQVSWRLVGTYRWPAWEVMGLAGRVWR